jgi:glycerophosphoryl diester phosphodiesterase
LPPRLHEGFLLTAHRGAVDVAPENTLLAFAEAERLGLEEIELDVQVTRDDVLVIGHDRTYDRVAASNFAGWDLPLEDLPYESVRCIDLGLEQRVPTFDEALDATSVSLQVEIKSPRAASRLAAALARRAAVDRDRCVVTSFHPQALAEFQQHATPGARGTGLLVASLDTDWRFDAETLGVRNLYLHWPGLTGEIVDELRSCGYRVCASMFNHAGDLRRIIETGVDGSSTDRPVFAKALIAGLAGDLERLEFSPAT